MASKKSKTNKLTMISFIILVLLFICMGACVFAGYVKYNLVQKQLDELNEATISCKACQPARGGTPKKNIP